MPDELGRDTPRGTMAGFISAVANEDFQKAAQYLDLSHLSPARRKTQGADLAERLQNLFDKGGRIRPPAMLSDDSVGKLNDDEPDNMDKIGTVHSGGKDTDVLVQRVTDASNKVMWLFSSQIVSQITELQEGLQEPRINKILPVSWIEEKWEGAPAGHWMATLIIFVAANGLSWMLMFAVGAILSHFFFKDKTKQNIIEALVIPAGLYLAVWIFAFLLMFLGVSVIVRQYAGQVNIVIAWISLAVLLWRLIDVFAELTQKRINRHIRYSGFSSIIFFMRRITKFFFVVVTGIIVLNSLGVNVTAGLAALGIGGIALALGAQKTLENFIGSVAIVLDQPIHIGDFCKIGDNVGTIEDIGMRSTRLRTNDRTLITIPNGNLSSIQIENFAARDRILLSTKLRIRYDAQPGQIDDLLQRIKNIFAVTPEIIQDPLAARFIGFIPEAQVIEIFVYVSSPDFNIFLKVQETVMLKIMEAVRDSGCFFAMPLQTILPAYN